MARKLYRAPDRVGANRKVWGVCGGLGDYFDVDPTLVRIIFVILAFANGIGIILYLLLAIFVPTAPMDRGAPATPAGPAGPQPAQPAAPPGSAGLPQVGRGPLIAGIALIVIGGLWLLSNLGFPWWPGWRIVWPVVLILLGLAILLGRWRR